jgi:hypothetical protein
MRVLTLALLLAVPAETQDDKAAPKIELKGLLKFEGISFKQGQATKYSGDTFVLKLAFTDAKGESYQPLPTMNFLVYNGNEAYKKSQRLITKENWKTDAAKMSSANIADNSVACDKKTGELHVAFVRADPGFECKIDLTIEIKGVGTWVWKDMDYNTEWKSAPKGPDKEKK